MHLSCPLFLVSLCTITVATQNIPGSQQPVSLFDESSVLTARFDSAISGILKEFKTPGGVGVAVLFDVLGTGLLISNQTLTPRVSWTSKIASIIPEWKLMDPVATRESAIVDLISHRTGLPRHDFMTSLDVHIPQVLLNTAYENYVDDNILAPLGMDAYHILVCRRCKTGRHLADGFLRENANLTEDPFAQARAARCLTGTRAQKVTLFPVPEESFPVTWLQMLLMEGKSQSNETMIPAEVIRKVATGVTVFTAIAWVELLSAGILIDLNLRTYPELSPVVYGDGQMRGTYRGYG
ncbi:Beta-lactamase class penicillin binding protein [Mycena venus]|uniref:Beta-lactamase class penicillin binding protein n=1 Tax=Mycena venus TaxID=2733690 RepID=A0A8H6Y1V5_9AGAR|nr:Beta-lactamase class penicillin binding protein [Mycena venus]